LVPWGSDPEIAEKHSVVGSLLTVSGTPSVICNRQSKIYNPKSDSQGGEIGRRARLRIAKSSISKCSFSFQETFVLRGENAIFGNEHPVRER
jgi:hypothetical protein